MPAVYDIITDRMIKLLEQGTVPWHKPWRSGGEPKNLISGKEYRGVNVFLLSSSGYREPWWLSYKQAQDRGGQVKKGEHGFPCVYWNWKEKEDSSTGKRKKIPFLRYYTVFNVEQVQSLEYPKLEDLATSPFTPIERCTKIVQAMPHPPVIEHHGNAASYNVYSDLVLMPAPEQFDTPESYYCTFFHELTHSTGHPMRLSRIYPNEFIRKPESYAREELVAEMGATFLCGHAGIERTVMTNSASYIASWLSRLRGDPRLVVQAAGQAQRSTDYILNKKFEEA